MSPSHRWVSTFLQTQVFQGDVRIPSRFTVYVLFSNQKAAPFPSFPPARLQQAASQPQRASRGLPPGRAQVCGRASLRPAWPSWGGTRLRSRLLSRLKYQNRTFSRRGGCLCIPPAKSPAPSLGGIAAVGKRPPSAWRLVGFSTHRNRSGCRSCRRHPILRAGLRQRRGELIQFLTRCDSGDSSRVPGSSKDCAAPPAAALCPASAFHRGRAAPAGPAPASLPAARTASRYLGGGGRWRAGTLPWGEAPGGTAKGAGPPSLLFPSLPLPPPGGPARAPRRWERRPPSASRGCCCSCCATSPLLSPAARPGPPPGEAALPAAAWGAVPFSFPFGELRGAGGGGRWLVPPPPPWGFAAAPRSGRWMGRARRISAATGRRRAGGGGRPPGRSPAPGASPGPSRTRAPTACSSPTFPWRTGAPSPWLSPPAPSAPARPAERSGGAPRFSVPAWGRCPAGRYGLQPVRRSPPSGPPRRSLWFRTVLSALLPTAPLPHQEASWGTPCGFPVSRRSHRSRSRSLPEAALGSRLLETRLPRTTTRRQRCPCHAAGFPKCQTKCRWAPPRVPGPRPRSKACGRGGRRPLGSRPRSSRSPWSWAPTAPPLSKWARSSSFPRVWLPK